MPNLKKIISLNQASKISGYHQDYLSSLIRKNELKGEKIGNSWFTTEEEIRKYLAEKEKSSIIKKILKLEKLIS